MSRPSTIISNLMQREIHLMSLGERSAAFLALYNQRVFDLQEQRVLFTGPWPHPLHGHPNAMGLDLPAFKGTINVAERLNCLSQHPTVMFKPVQEDPDTWKRVPYPYLGDLLLFINDDQGPFCINWTVKKDEEDFKKFRLGRRSNPNRETADQEKAARRHKVEEIYHQDVGIRTVQVTSSAIPARLAANLNRLFGWHNRKLKISESQQSELLRWYQTEMQKRTPPIRLLSPMMQKLGCSREDCLGVLYQGIWKRELRVDLFHPILVDHPLCPEMKDALVEFAHWFGR